MAEMRNDGVTELRNHGITEIRNYGSTEPRKYGVTDMTQEESWNIRYNEVKAFIETNHRNPSRHRLEEHDMLNWV